MIDRKIRKRIVKLAKEYGVLSITGPRQSGKTTLVKDIFPKHKYVNLENIHSLALIKEDPVQFIKTIKNGVVIDEVQRFPEILSYIQVSIDEKYRPGKFILTGSQNLLLLDKVSQSLAGRVAIIKLLPLSLSELDNADILPKGYLSQIQTGFYPAIFDKKMDVVEYYSNYINTYVERDVRSIKNIGDLSQFTKFMQLLAGRIGQILNLSSIGSEIGVSHHTINSWLSVLEASYIVYLLEPFFKNKNKRLIKSPKVYFYDVGLACHLLRLNNSNDVRNYYSQGSLFENLVVIDILKQKFNTGSNTGLYYYRDSNQNEVDLLLDFGVNIQPVEIKSSMTYNSDFIKTNLLFNKINPISKDGMLIYAGDEEFEVKKVRVINYIKSACLI